MSNEERIQLNKKKKVQHWQKVTLYLVAYDVVAVTMAYFLALLIRFDFAFSRIPIVYFQPWAYFAPVYAIVCILVFWRLRLYNSIWRFASFKELERITYATIVTTIIQFIGVTITLYFVVKGTEYNVSRMPVSYYIMGMMIQFMLITAVRFSYRYILLLRASRNKKNLNRIALVGAGAAGREILADLRRSPQIKEQVVCFIDDNKNKWGRDIDGIPVVGGRDSIIETVRDMSIDKIYIALPSVSAKERKEIIDICR